MSEPLKVEWTEALATGNRAVDVQHKYLIDIINDLAEAIENDRGGPALKKIIHLLQYYTEWHFCREEECMERLNCPTACANKEAHAKFLCVIVDFKTEFKKTGGSNELALKMYKVLTGWLVTHIQGIDSALAKVSVNDKTNLGA